MTDQLTSLGLTIDSLETRLATVKAALRTSISPTLDLSPDQPDGQLLYIFLERLQAAMELLEEIYTILDPDSATGHALTYLSTLTGTQRRAASYGVVELRLTLDAAITVPAGSVANVLDQSTNRWATDEEVTSTGAGQYYVNATALTAGAIQALAGTITVISTPVAGWTAVTNLADATEGEEEETDTALRLRRELELTASGSTSVNAIRADLLALTGCDQCLVMENTTDSTDGDGRPAHSVEALVYGSDPPLTDALVAETLWDSKAAGIETYGDDGANVEDSMGNLHWVAFNRATVVEIDVEVTLTTTASYAGDDAVKAAIVAVSDDYLIGGDVIVSKIAAAAFVVGVEDVTLTRVRYHAGSWGTSNLSILLREIAHIDVANITVIT